QSDVTITDQEGEQRPSLFEVAAQRSRHTMGPRSGGEGGLGAGSDREMDSIDLSTASQRTENKATPFMRESIDLAAVASSQAAPVAGVAPATVSAPIPTSTPVAVVRANLHELYNQLAKEITALSAKGETHTVIQLSAATGLFDGARLVVSEFDTARNSVNL